jgi:hypothetical protein
MVSVMAYDNPQHRKTLGQVAAVVKVAISERSD